MCSMMLLTPDGSPHQSESGPGNLFHKPSLMSTGRTLIRVQSPIILGGTAMGMVMLISGRHTA